MSSSPVCTIFISIFLFSLIFLLTPQTSIQGVEPQISVGCDILYELIIPHGLRAGPGSTVSVQRDGTMNIAIGGDYLPPNHWIFVQLQSVNSAPNTWHDFQQSKYNFNDGEWRASNDRGEITNVLFPNVKFYRDQFDHIAPFFITKIYDGGPHNNHIQDPPDIIEGLSVYRDFPRFPNIAQDCQRVPGWDRHTWAEHPEDHQGSAAQEQANFGQDKQENQDKMLEDKTSALDKEDMEQGMLPPSTSEPKEITKEQGQLQDENQTIEK